MQVDALTEGEIVRISVDRITIEAQTRPELGGTGARLGCNNSGAASYVAMVLYVPMVLPASGCARIRQFKNSKVLRSASGFLRVIAAKTLL